MLLTFGIRNIAQVADFLIGQLTSMAICIDDGQLAIFAEFGDRIDKHLGTGDVTFLNSLFFGGLVDIDILRDLVIVDYLADNIILSSVSRRLVRVSKLPQ